MRNKLLAFLLSLALLCPAPVVRASSASHTYTADEVEDLFGGIVAYKESVCGASSVQEYIDTALCETAGTTAEYYAITLSQSGSYDFSRYEKALLSYLKTNNVYSAATREKYALALIACGSADSYIWQVCDSDIGGLGLMSLVFGLHLLNNGYDSKLYTTDELIYTILGYQLSDGGWAVIGGAGDVDVTAMTVQALAPYYGYYGDVTEAVDSALSLLSSRQLDSGGFKSMGTENCESAAQVLTALSALYIDQNTDTRFIKNGNTVLDAIMTYRNADGSFAHTGGGFNESATTQALYALCAYMRMLYGEDPYYILDNRRPEALKPAASPTQSQGSSGGSGSGSRGGSTSGGRTTGGGSGGGKADDIIYIGGQAYVRSTDAEGEDVTVRVTEPSYPTEPPHGEYAAPTGSAVFQPTGTATNISTADEAPAKGGYKVYAVIGILSAAAIVSLILFLRKKRGIKNYIAVIILTAAAVTVILLTNFESKESYSAVGEKMNTTGSVTMTIRCDILNDEDDKPAYIPDDGIILPETTFTIGEGDTVYDILLEASKTYSIHIDNRGGEHSAYISGIQYLYEFDYGGLSGWMYRVNGEFPEVGCQGCRLSGGDRIEWLYTRDIGRDL